MAAHNKCEITFRPPQTNITLILNDGSGFPEVSFSSIGFSPSVGEQVYLFSGYSAYSGFYTIKAITSSTSFTLDTPYIGSSGVLQPIYFCKKPTILLYKGWAQGELSINSVDMYTVQPQELIATIKPEANLNGLFVMDIGGYLKAALPNPYRYIYNPDEVSWKTTGILGIQCYLEAFTQVKVVCEGNLEFTLRVFNSALTTADLNRLYVNTGLTMKPVFTNYQFTNYTNTDDYIQYGLQIRY